MTPQPTDADREKVESIEDQMHGYLRIDDQRLLEQAFAEVRVSAYAQGRADEWEACAEIVKARWTAACPSPQMGDGVDAAWGGAFKSAYEAIRARAAQEGGA